MLGKDITHHQMRVCRDNLIRNIPNLTIQNNSELRKNNDSNNYLKIDNETF